MVEQLTYYPKFKGLNLAPGGTEREKIAKVYFYDEGSSLSKWRMLRQQKKWLVTNTLAYFDPPLLTNR